MALTGSLVRRLPLEPSLIYLLLGFALGPYGVAMIDIDPIRDAVVLERVLEVAVIIALFTAGLKLRSPFHHPQWRLPIRLGTISMIVTVALVAAVAMPLLGLSLGAAVLLGAILAPTDPVLASSVQVTDAGDRDRLRFSLTGEAGLNDGTAFPFVMLGLGLLGHHEIGAYTVQWLAWDVVWAVTAGIGVGALAGTGVGELVLYLRREHREAAGLDDFLSLGLLALSYGIALALGAYGFLAAFAAGLALRRVEATTTGHDESPSDVLRAAAAEEKEDIATDPETAPAHMAHAVLGFNEPLERIAEVAMVIALGAMLTIPADLVTVGLLALLLFVVLRPVAVWIGSIGEDVTPIERLLMGWFGIRGIGSVYYLTYVVAHGVGGATAHELATVTFTIVALSILVHGTTVTPLMAFYRRMR